MNFFWKILHFSMDSLAQSLNIVDYQHSKPIPKFIIYDREEITQSFKLEYRLKGIYFLDLGKIVKLSFYFLQKTEIKILKNK